MIFFNNRGIGNNKLNGFFSCLNAMFDELEG